MPDSDTSDLLYQSALDQASILLDYLQKTPAKEVDLDFLREHADAMIAFAAAAKSPELPRGIRKPG